VVLQGDGKVRRGNENRGTGTAMHCTAIFSAQEGEEGWRWGYVIGEGVL
jgi:hypothetical protein